MLAMGRALMGEAPAADAGRAVARTRAARSCARSSASSQRCARTGVSILLVEQNARAALQVSDYGYVLETGELALEGPSAELAQNPRVAATYLGRAAGLPPEPRETR